MKLMRLLAFLIVISLTLIVNSACTSPNEDSDSNEDSDAFVRVVDESELPQKELEVASSEEPAYVGQGGKSGNVEGAAIAEVAEEDSAGGKSSEGETRVEDYPAESQPIIDSLPVVKASKAEVKGFGGLGLSGAGRGVSVRGLSARGVSGASGHVSAMRAPVSVRGTEAFNNYGTNDFVDPRKDSLATFAADVDTASYSIVKRKLRAGALPPAAAVRVEEFVNYFDYDYGAPEDGPFSVSLEAAPSPFSANTSVKVLRVGVQAKSLTQAERKPAHVTFLVDVSGSMSGSDRLDLAKHSMRVLIGNLQASDTVSIVTYAGRVRVALEATDATDKLNINRAIDSLRAGGSTAMGPGMKLAYEQAVQRARPGHVSRVVVMSDGDANLGAGTHDEILKSIEKYVEDGVTMSTVGFGMGNYKDVMMEQLANRGNGNYVYVEDKRAASRVFESELDGLLQVVAKDVKFQVEFSPEFVEAYRLVGYENRDIADEDFRDDAVDAGEVGAGHRVTALFEVRLKESAPSSFAKVRIRHKDPDESVATERAYPLPMGKVHERVSEASEDFQFALAVSTFAEILRDSPYAKDLSFDLVLEVAQLATRKRVERREFVELVKQAASLSDR